MNVDTILYALAAALTAAIGYSGAIDWRFVATVVLATCIAIKAKRSPGVDNK